MGAVGRQAVVLGASVGGLLAARVLANSFASVTVIERDTIPSRCRDFDEALPKRVVGTRCSPRVGTSSINCFPDCSVNSWSHGASVWDDGDWSKLYMSITSHVMLHQVRASFRTTSRSHCTFPLRPWLRTAI